MGADLKLSCRCGKVTARLQGHWPGHGSLVRCHCRDCRSFARHIGAAEALDDNGGTAIFQTVPGRLEFLTGTEHLRCLRLSPNGLLRWFASCCGTPMGNIMKNPKFGFVGLPLLAFPEPGTRDAMGPMICSIHSKHAPPGSQPPPDFGFMRAGLAVMRRHIATRLGLAPRGSPFFDAAGLPIVDPDVLTRDQRAQASAM
ncbi:MAG: hypothetical protein GY717_14630 [Rhodobacteraceae bacterium]|nr:hypothetical protein [Paracoccaceae bacterium]